MCTGRKFWLAAASYVALALLVVGVKPILTPNLIAGDGVDLPGTLWIHWWVGQTVEAGTWPITSNLFFFPDGKNFFNDTGANFVDAYLGVPFQWLFGVPDFLDPLQVVILVGNALAMQALALDLTRGRLAPAWAAAVAFELCPHVITQVGEGRPTQALLWFGVLATRHGLRLAQGTWGDAVLFGLFTVLQGLTYWYTLYFAAIAWLPLVGMQLVQAPRRVAPRLLLAVAIVFAVSAPFLVRISAEIAAGHVARTGHGDWATGPAAVPSRWRLLLEQVGNASWIAILALAALSLRRTWPWLLGVLCTGAFAVGALVGVTDPPLVNRVYLALLEYLPLLGRLGFPERITAFTYILLCMCLATALATRSWRGAAAFVCLLVADTAWRKLPVVSIDIEIPEGNDRVRREGGAMIFLPFGVSERAMISQTRHRQPLFGGMGDREADLRPQGFQDRLSNGFIIMLGATLNDEHAAIGYTAEDRATVSERFRWVWLDLTVSNPRLNDMGYAPSSKYRRLVRELGAPVARDPTWALWDLRAPVPDDAPGLAAAATLATDELRPLGFGARGTLDVDGASVNRFERHMRQF